MPSAGRCCCDLLSAVHDSTRSGPPDVGTRGNGNDGHAARNAYGNAHGPRAAMDIFPTLRRAQSEACAPPDRPGPEDDSLPPAQHTLS